MKHIGQRWRGLSDRQREGACWFVLLLPVLAVLWPLWLAGRAPLPDYLPWFEPWRELGSATSVWNPLWYDALGQYWPWRILLTDGLLANALPFWTPFQLDGYSLVANGQSALFYPPNWLFFGVFGVGAGFRLTAVFHLWLAGVGTYRLLRELGASRSAALLSGCAFELSSFLVLWLPLPTLVSSAAWMPWACAFLQRARRKHEGVWAWTAGITVGLSAAAGHPQIFYFVALAATIVLIGVVPRRYWPAFVVAAGLTSAPALLPVLEAAPLGHRPVVRTDATYEGFLGRALGAERLVTIVQPKFFGDPGRGTIQPQAEPRQIAAAAAGGLYWGQDRQGAIAAGDYTEFALFVGLMPLCLALLGCAVPGPARLYGLLGLAGLALACGFPLNRLLFFHLPGWAAGGGPCRLAVWWCFGIAVAAGLGLDAVQRCPRQRLWWPAVLVLAGHLLIWVLWVGRNPGLQLLYDATLLRRLIGLLSAVAWLAVGTGLLWWRPRWLVLVVVVELLVFGWGAVPTCPTSRLDRVVGERWRQSLLQLAEHDRVVIADAPTAWGFYRPPEGMILPPNLATAVGLRDAGGYESLMPAASKQRLSRLAQGRPISPAINGNMLLLGNLAELPPGVQRGLPSSPQGEPRCDVPLLVDRNNVVAIEAQPGRHVIWDTSYPGWRFYDQRGHEQGWTGQLGSGRVFEVVQAGVYRFVFRPVTVRLGIFLGLIGLLATAWLVTRCRPTPQAG